MYATRLERLKDADRLLWKQAQMERSLINGYWKAVAMIEIEIESYAVADSVSEDAIGRIDAKIAELDALKEEIQDRERELEANDELERFLAASGSPEL
jgi:hypothetical protein